MSILGSAKVQVHESAIGPSAMVQRRAGALMVRRRTLLSALSVWSMLALLPNCTRQSAPSSSHASAAVTSELPRTPAMSASVTEPPAPAFPPPNYFVVARAQHPFLIFPTRSGSLVATEFSDDPRAYGFFRRPWIAHVSERECATLEAPDELPSVGTVDLNLDSKKRWGTRKGGSEAAHNFANPGRRYIVSGGQFSTSGDAWLAFQIEAGPPVVDLYAHESGHWKLVWTSYPTPTVWSTARSRADLEGVVAVKRPSAAINGRKQEPWTLFLWKRASGTESAPLATQPALLESVRESPALGTFADGTAVLVTPTFDGAVAVERVSPAAKNSRTWTFPKVNLGPIKYAATECPRRARRLWDVEFASQGEFVVWRSGSSAVRFSLDSATEASTYQPELVPTKSSGDVAAHFGDDFCEQSPLGGSTRLVSVRHEAHWYLLSTRKPETPCAQPPSDKGG